MIMRKDKKAEEKLIKYCSELSKEQFFESCEKYCSEHSEEYIFEKTEENSFRFGVE